nr:universal stress protein PHOS34-like isoform X2 [Ipomoea batatas]
MVSPKRPPAAEDAERPPTAIMHQPASPRFPSGRPQRKVAIAVDLSDESAYAVKWAVQNYLRPGDAVILLHVRPTSVLYGADWGAVDLSVVSEAAAADEESQQKLEDDFDNFTTFHIVKDHDMKERLCLEVERLGLSAVIMGSRGFGASRRSAKGRLGTVSDYCVQHCVCPVVVVRYPDEKDGGVGPTKSADDRIPVPAPAPALQPVPEEEPIYHDASDKATGLVLFYRLCASSAVNSALACNIFHVPFVEKQQSQVGQLIGLQQRFQEIEKLWEEDLKRVVTSMDQIAHIDLKLPPRPLGYALVEVI